MNQTAVARACALVLVALVSAPAVAKKKPEPAPEVLAPTHGYVFADLPKGTAGALSVQRLGTEADPVILWPRDGEEVQRTVGGWLPAGEYRIASYDGIGYGQDTRIEVQAGRVTDLGTLIPVTAGGYNVVLLPVREDEHERDVDAAVKQFANVLADPAPIRWTPARPPAPGKVGVGPSDIPGGGVLENMLAGAIARDAFKKNTPDAIPSLHDVASIPEFQRLAKQFAQPTTDGQADGAGRVYFPAPLGAIRVREQDGTWSAIDTGTFARIASVHAEGDTLLAGTDDGRLMRSNDRGTTWTLASRLPADQAIIDIAHAGDQWFVTTESYKRTEVAAYTFNNDIAAVRVYTAPDADLSTTTLLHTLAYEPSNKWGAMQMQKPRAHMTKDAYFVMGGDGVHRFDLATRTWRRVPTPKGKIASFRFDATDTTMVAYGTGTMVSKVFLSRDAGESWQTLPKPSIGYREMTFDADGRGYAFRIDFGPKTERWEVEEYNATTGGDWERTSFLPIRCRPMRVGAGTPALCVTTGSDIYALKDGKWVMEFDAQ